MQPLALAVMLVPASCVKAVRFVNLTLAFSAVPDERVMAIASSTLKSPSVGPLTVRPDQIWSLPAGMLKSMAVACVVSVTVTPVPTEKFVPAERFIAPDDVSDEELP